MGERFGGFELEARLGAGGMAETFAATRRFACGLEQRVCVKRILPSLREDPRFVTMFLEEARIAARLRHATIVQVLDAGEHDGTPYMALELIDGADLRRVIDAARRARARLDAEHVALVALELATALEVAHRGGVLHRDVSPANVMISAAGEVKLADFGIAKAEDGALRTATGIAKGKASYMAPEYVETGRATPRSDLYALGVTLFEAAAGRRPFAAKTPLASAIAAASSRAQVSEHAPELPASLADAIDRLLDPDPQGRFPSAADLFDALADVTPAPGARRRLGAIARATSTAAPTADDTVACPPPVEEGDTRVLRARR